NAGQGPSTSADASAGARPQRMESVTDDDFSGAALSPAWQWPIGRRPNAHVAGGKLALESDGQGSASAVQSVTAASYVAETLVDRATLSPGAFAGLAIFGDRVNHL